MTCSILVQGPWNSRWLERYHDYSRIFDQIVISCYKEDMPEIQKYPELVSNHNIQIVLSDTAFPPGVDWYGNIWHQSKTTLAGLRQCTSEFTVKTRCDEYWSNLHLFRERFTKSHHLQSVNIFFKRWNRFPLHIGDHLFGGNTQQLQKGFHALHELLRVDYFHNIQRVAEQKIASALLMSQGEVPNWYDCRQQLKDHWQVIDAQLLEPFYFNAPSIGTVATTLDQLRISQLGDPSVELFDCIDKYLE